MVLSKYFWVFLPRLGVPSAVTLVLFGRCGTWLYSVPSPHPKSHLYASHLHWHQMGTQVREKILNYHHSPKRVVSLKNEALAVSGDVQKPSEEGQSWLGLGLSRAGINHRSSRQEIAVQEMEAEKWDLSAGFPWT